MGYTTYFEGQINLDKPLTVKQLRELEELAGDRHEGEHFPSVYCQWVPTEDGEAIVWDGNEKFNEYIEWMEYIIQNFLNHWKIVANGEITWSGDEQGDVGRIVVKDNVVKIIDGQQTSEPGKTSIVIVVDLDNDAFVDRTAEELQDIFAQITRSPMWSKICDGEEVSLSDSNGIKTGKVLIEN